MRSWRHFSPVPVISSVKKIIANATLLKGIAGFSSICSIKKRLECHCVFMPGFSCIMQEVLDGFLVESSKLILFFMFIILF